MSIIRRGPLVLSLLLGFSDLSFAAWPTDPNVNLPICTAPNHQWQPRIALDGAGGAYIVWYDYRDSGTQPGIYAQHVLDSGVPSPAWPVNGLWLGQGWNPEIGADGTGGAFVAWSASPEMYDARCRAQRILPGGVAPGWPAGGLLLTPFALNSVQSPRVAADGAGGAFVTWQTSYGFFTAQHVGPNGEIALLPWLVNETQGQWGGLIWDGVGGAIAGWGEAGGSSTMRVQHLSWTYDPFDPFSPGLSMWTAGGVPVGTGSPEQNETALAGDGAGGAFVAWWQYDGEGTNAILVQHVLVDGTVDPAWPFGGRIVKSAPAFSLNRPAVVSDGADGVIVAWLDNGPPGNAMQKVFAGHLLADGSLDPAWPAGGLPMGSEPVGSVQTPGPRMVSDGAGGAVIAWGGFNYSGIYAQRVLANGTLDPAWPSVTGATVSLGPNKYEPMSISDGAGGAIITWYEGRAGGNAYDIFAQRVTSDGQLGDDVTGVAPTPSLTFTLEAVHPNPARGRSLTVAFSLASEVGASVDLFDVAGRRVASREVGSLGPGRHSIGLHAGTSCPSGMYFLRLQQGPQVVSTRVLLLK